MIFKWSAILSLESSGAKNELYNVQSCADKLWTTVRVQLWRVRGVPVYTPRRLPGNWKFPASEKNYLNKKNERRNHLSNKFPCAYVAKGLLDIISLLFSPGWRSPIFPTLIRLPIVVLLPVRGWRRTYWRIISPSSSRVNRVVVLLETFKMLTLSCLMCRMDWTDSFARTFNMIFVQLTIRVLRFTKSRALPHWTLFSLFISRDVPGLLISASFFRCSFVRMIFQCKCVILSYLFFCLSMFRQILAIFCVLMPPFKNSFALILCGFGVPQHIACFVVHCLTQWLAMPRTAGLVLLYCVSRNRQHVKSVFVEVSTLSRRLQAFSAFAVYDTNFPMHSAIRALSFRRRLAELEDFGIAHVSDQILWFFTEMVDLLSKSFSNTFLFGWFPNCLINRLTVSLRFASTCSTVECGMPGIRKSARLMLHVSLCSCFFALDFLESVTGGSSRLCCGFGASVTRGNLGDWFTLHYNCSPDFMHTTFSVHIAGSVLERVIACDRVGQNCNPFLGASFKLHQYTVLWWALQVCLYGAILGLSRSYSTSSRSCRAYIGFAAVKNTDCLSFLRLFPPRISPFFDNGVHFESVLDVVDVLGKVIRQQYIVLQWWINKFTSWMCGRMVYRQGAILLIRRRRSRCFPWRCPHGRSASQNAGRVWKRRGKRRRESGRKTERGSNKGRTIQRSSWMTWRWNDARIRTLEPCSVNAHQLWGVNCMRKMTCEVCLSTHTVGYSGSPSTANGTNCNKKKYLKFYYELHQLQSDVSHHESLEEGCHRQYCCGEMGSATCSLDSRWTRFLRETAARKSDRSRIGPFLPDMFKARYHCPWYLLTSCRERVRVVLFCKFVHLFALLFCPSDCELWFTINWISEKSIVNTCKMSTLRVNFLAASLPRIPGDMVLFLFFSFTVSSTMTAQFFDHVVRDRESIQSKFVKLSSGFAFNQELSAGAVDNSLVPIEKTLRTLHCWYCVAQLE